MNRGARDVKTTPLTGADLHVHTWGCYHPQDLLSMVRGCHREMDWSLFDFPRAYERAFGRAVDPARVFEEALATGSLEGVKELSVCGPGDGGSFERFDARTLAAVCITRYWVGRGRLDVILEPIIRRHRAEGLKYVEYRCGPGDAPFEEWYPRYLRHLRDSSRDGFTARAVVRLHRDDVWGSYRRLRRLLDERPEFAETVVGIDFGGREIPPRRLQSFFGGLREDNRRRPEMGLDAVMHVGEVFYDKSLESGVRWCHEAAELGAARLGHCTVLGMDPRTAVARCPGAHTRETAAERLDQVAYDLRWCDRLITYGVRVDVDGLLRERTELERKSPGQMIERVYDDDRLKEVLNRQDFVLDVFRNRGTVIEVCPTSTLRIAGIASMETHPVGRFYEAGVNMVISTDDPGVLDISLASEVDLVARHLGISLESMGDRLGDPRDFRLGRSR